MGKNYDELTKNIVSLVGGKENIVKAQHCATRLRINLKDTSLVKNEQIDELQGVIGTQWSGSQYQIIIGSSVGDVYASLVKNVGIASQEVINENLDVKKKITLNSVLQYASGSLIDTIPGMLGCAFISVILSICTTFGILSTDSSTYKVLYICANAFYTMFPIIVGGAAAKRIGTNPYMAMAIGAVMASSELTALYADGNTVTLFGIPVTQTTYASTIFPILLCVPVLKIVYDFFGKHLPEVIKIFAQPLLTLLILFPIALCVLGPLGGIIGNYLGIAIQFLYSKCGFITVTLLCAFYPFVVMTGMHYALIPICMSFFVAEHFDPLIMVAMFVGNMAEGGATLGVALKSKKVNTKSTAVATGISCILAGIIEPALYGINLRYRKPLIAAIIGGGVAGLFAGLMEIKMYGGVSSIFGIIGFFGYDGGISNFIVGIITIALAIIVPFVLVQFIYKDEVKA